MLRTLPLAAALVLAFGPAEAQDTPDTVIYTYESFTSEWGPGPAIEKAFEATCACDLQFVPAGDGAALLARVQLEGAASDADVVLGLDTSLTAAATATGWSATSPTDLPAATTRRSRTRRTR